MGQFLLHAIKKWNYSMNIRLLCISRCFSFQFFICIWYKLQFMKVRCVSQRPLCILQIVTVILMTTFILEDLEQFYVFVDLNVCIVSRTSTFIKDAITCVCLSCAINYSYSLLFLLCMYVCIFFRNLNYHEWMLTITLLKNSNVKKVLSGAIK